MILLRNSLLILFVLSTLHTEGQELAKNVYSIKNIFWQSCNYEDVRFFENVLSKNHTIVLSESDHGHGLSYEAQCMILKGLIDSGKIDAIFIESNWINVSTIVTVLKREGRSSIKKTIDYMRSLELRYWVDNGFWEFLANNIIEGKVTLVGFDIDGLSPKIMDSLFKEATRLNSVKKYIGSNSKDFKNIEFEFEHFGGWGLQSRYNISNYLRQRKFIETIISEYKSVGNEERIQQWQSILDFFYWMAKRTEVSKNNRYSNKVETEKQNSWFHSTRDSLMSEVFYRYYLKNRDKRIVCLSASYHAIKFPELISSARQCCLDSGVNILGEILRKKYKLDIYNIVFISSSGEYGINYGNFQMKYPQVVPPVKGSLELSLKDQPFRYCLVDLSTVSEPFYMNAVFNRYLKSNWSKNFSAAFYIRIMEPTIIKGPFK